MRNTVNKTITIVCLMFIAINTYSYVKPAFCRLPDNHAALYVIQQSWQGYPGNCPCPYSRNARGHLCGATSAYSKPGGREPKCYPQDVSQSDIRKLKEQYCR